MRTSSSLRIEMVLPSLVAAGMEVVVSRLTRGLSARGHVVGVTCIQSDGTVADALRADGFRVSVVPAPGLRANLFPKPLAGWLRQVAPDVVHVHSGAWLKGARAARLANVPHTVHTVHGIEGNEPWFTKPMWRMASRYTDAIVSVSHPLMAYLDHDMGLGPDKLRLIPNGIDSVSFAPGPRPDRLRAALGIEPEALLVGNVARLAVVKNHALLLDAFAAARVQLPEARLAIVGEGGLRADLAQRIRALGVDTHVHLAGAAADMPQVYREFDLFVLSSAFEGTSLSLLEAMASGLCVIATAVGGTPDLLGYGKFGVLVPPDDPAALTSAIVALGHDPARRRQIGMAAREHVVRNYSESTMVRRYEDLYAGLLLPAWEKQPAPREKRLCAE